MNYLHPNRALGIYTLPSLQIHVLPATSFLAPTCENCEWFGLQILKLFLNGKLFTQSKIKQREGKKCYKVKVAVPSEIDTGSKHNFQPSENIFRQFKKDKHDKGTYRGIKFQIIIGNKYSGQKCGEMLCFGTRKISRINP